MKSVTICDVKTRMHNFSAVVTAGTFIHPAPSGDAIASRCTRCLLVHQTWIVCLYGPRRMRKWFGVRAVISCGSDDTYATGLNRCISASFPINALISFSSLTSAFQIHSIPTLQLEGKCICPRTALYSSPDTSGWRHLTLNSISAVGISSASGLT